MMLRHQRALLLFSAAVAVASTALSADPKAPTHAVAATLHSAHDADTFICTVHLGFGVDLPNRRIRAFGYDAYEVNRVRNSKATKDNPITDDEIAKGIKARDEFLELLKLGELHLEESSHLDPSAGDDPYGRISAVPWLKLKEGWLFIPGWLEAHGHLRVPRGR